MENSSGYNGVNCSALLTQLSKTTLTSPLPHVRSSQRHRIINDGRFLSFLSFVTSKLRSNDSYMSGREWCNAAFYFGQLGCFPASFRDLVELKSPDLAKECTTMEITMLVDGLGKGGETCERTAEEMGRREIVESIFEKE
ncbi:hypothetical protein TrRE_jg12202, partial [Triparma retinervis]